MPNGAGILGGGDGCGRGPCRLGCTDGFFRLVAACCRSCFGSYPSKRWLLELLVKIRLQILPVVLV